MFSGLTLTRLFTPAQWEALGLTFLGLTHHQCTGEVSLYQCNSDSAVQAQWEALGLTFLVLTHHHCTGEASLYQRYHCNSDSAIHTCTMGGSGVDIPGSNTPPLHRRSKFISMLSLILTQLFTPEQWEALGLTFFVLTHHHCTGEVSLYQCYH